MATSLPRIAHHRQSGNGIRDELRQWTLWSFPAWCVAWVLLGNAAAVTLSVLTLCQEHWPTSHQLILFGGLAVAATAHVVFTRPDEERERAARLRYGKVEHVDQTSIWLFSAALILPVSLVLLLVIILRAQRYLIARKPPSRWVFTSSSIVLSALGVHWIGAHTYLTYWLRSGHVSAVSSIAISATGGLVAAIAVYFLVQAVLIGVYRGLLTGSWSLPSMLGSLPDNVFIVYTLVLASVAAVVAGFAPLLLVAMAVVAIQGTRNEHRKSQLIVEREQAELDALHDAKTGLLNARGFGVHSEAALAKDHVLGQTSSFLMCDLDHFKQWNTRLGHVGADLLLRAVADTVRANVRPTDLVCRWGGEEIAVLLPNTDVSRAADVAERLRSAVEELTLTVSRPAGEGTITIPGADNNVPRCTISIGVASLSHGEGPNGRTATELLERVTRLADDAMYVAKATGRNRVSRADGVPMPDQSHGASQDPLGGRAPESFQDGSVVDNSVEDESFEGGSFEGDSFEGGSFGDGPDADPTDSDERMTISP
jgi:diguanylate cyclase (GGDEF)-like protein